ncbi:MAG: kelch repeat-containing protein [Thermoanaerobaculia bacterium]
MDHTGTYGAKGVEAPENVPGARSSSVSWTDTNGNLWLFGGLGWSASVDGALNDLWQWNVSSGEWTWVSGSSSVNQPGTYGTQGVAVPESAPGARYGSVAWADAKGNLWLFGGLGSDANRGGDQNDLWVWDISRGQWTWVSGSNLWNQGNSYGTNGGPGARRGALSWIDTADNLWLFGGCGYAGYAIERNFNDLWKWNSSSKQWTWLSGSTVADQLGVFGTRGVAAPGNVPSARSNSVSWADTNGNLWLFGGEFSEISFNLQSIPLYLNDLWKWNIASAQWTWVGGSDHFDQVGIYGIRGAAAPENAPGGRYGSVSWKDANGNLWLFGGFHYGWLNDLWVYVPPTASSAP